MVEEIPKWRKEIDKIDKEFFKLLKKRFEVAKKIGKYKIRNKIPIVNKKREKEIVDFWCKKTNLEKKFVKNFFILIFEESKRLQRRLR